ncbi:hypothetical protein [Streptomyces sp. SID3212]|uniref:hypothetical protein n=1 Tax=Streptomyces sp. SID3212 TaxID=2690259 RepID=UPI0013710ECC|nr:hypothetical protein [Streptomyces sp. SID3212]MYV58017.1 hypothetical protein [Streptomyces sp. SID3212]
MSSEEIHIVDHDNGNPDAPECVEDCPTCNEIRDLRENGPSLTKEQRGRLNSLLTHTKGRGMPEELAREFGYLLIGENELHMVERFADLSEVVEWISTWLGYDLSAETIEEVRHVTDAGGASNIRITSGLAVWEVIVVKPKQVQ